MASLPTSIGPYQVLAQLGQGGMGAVYEARHAQRGGPTVALKVAKPTRDDSSLALRRRFQREIKLMQRVVHPHVVRVLDVGHTAEGYDYLALERIEGHSLRLLAKGRPLPCRRAATIVRDLADAVTAMHAAGVLHRDLKPDNVMLRPDGSPVLLDFGLARGGDTSRLTQTGALLGTPAYMAPEQTDDASQVDERADVYGLGGILFYLLAGRAPFSGQSAFQLIKQVVLQDPRWPCDEDRRALARPDPSPGATVWHSAAPPTAAHDSAATVWGSHADAPAPPQPSPDAATRWESSAPPPATNPAGDATLVDDDATVAEPPPPAEPRAPQVAPPAWWQPPDGLDPALLGLLRQAMAKDPQQRFAGALALREALDLYLRGDAPPTKRRAPLTAGLVLLAGAGVALGLMARPSAAPPLPRPSGPDSSSPSGSGAPSPRAQPSASLAFRRAFAALPPISHPDFDQASQALVDDHGDAEGRVAQLRAARLDLLALRAAPPSARASQRSAWRVAHGDLSPDRVGPALLEVVEPRRWRHDEGSAQRRSSREEHAERYAARVGFLDDLGSQAVSADSRALVGWRLRDDLTRREPLKPAQGKWLRTTAMVIDRASGRVALGGRRELLDSEAFTEGRQAAGMILFDLTQPRLRVIDQPVSNGDGDRVLALALSRGGGLAALGDNDGRVLVLDLRAAPPRLLLEEFTRDKVNVRGVALGPRRVYALSGDDSKTQGSLEHWSLTGGVAGRLLELNPEIQRRRAHRYPALLSLDPDGDRLVVGRWSGASLALRPLSAAGEAGQPLLLAPQGEPLRRDPLQARFVSGWGVDALVTCTGWNEEDYDVDYPAAGVQVWDLASGTGLACFELDDPNDGVQTVDVADGGRLVIAGTQRGEVLLWELW